MRNWNQYLKLWQQKRNELHISTDMQTDWSDMHQLLDKHMPDNTPSADSDNAGHGGGGSGLGTGAKLLNLGKLKLLYVVAGLVIGGVVTYIAINQKTTDRHKKNKTEIRKDSLSSGNILKTDNLQRGNRVDNNNAIDNLKNDQNNSSTDANAGSSADNNIANENTPAGDSKVVNDHAKDISVRADAAKSAGEKSNGTSSGKTGHGNSGDLKNNHLLSSPSAIIKNGMVSGNGTRRRSGSYRAGRQSGPHYSSNQQNTFTSNNGRQTNNHNNHNTIAGDGQYVNGASTIKAATPASALTWDDVVANSNQNAVNFANAMVNSAMLTSGSINRNATLGENSSANKTSGKTDKKAKDAKASKIARNPTYKHLDWGLLAGTDGMGSLTPKSQNHNIYGSLPIDIYAGLFGTYNLNDRWALGLQSRFLVPHTVSGRYVYSHAAKDTTQAAETIQISDSRKVYTVDVPIHLIYRIAPNINLKGGPILSIPVKTANGTYPNAGNDSTGNANTVTKSLSATAPGRKILFGASAGIGFSYKSLWFDASYNYNPRPMEMKSDLGGYSSNTNSLQLTIGIKLNRGKK
jgi:hypothetical protein